jgi:hypothetical protein
VGKGRRVAALIGLRTSLGISSSGFGMGLLDDGLMPGHGEFRAERFTYPLQPRLATYRVNLGEEFVGQEEQYRGHVSILAVGWMSV